MLMSSKEELERLKKQLRDEEEKLKLEEEIRVIKGRLEHQEQGQISAWVKSSKAWLKKTDYWNSFIIGVVGIGLAELGIFLNIYFAGIIGGIMILGSLMLTPFLRPFWDTKYKPPKLS